MKYDCCVWQTESASVLETKTCMQIKCGKPFKKTQKETANKANKYSVNGLIMCDKVAIEIETEIETHRISEFLFESGMSLVEGVWERNLTPRYPNFFFL